MRTRTPFSGVSESSSRDPPHRENGLLGGLQIVEVEDRLHEQEAPARVPIDGVARQDLGPGQVIGLAGGQSVEGVGEVVEHRLQPAPARRRLREPRERRAPSSRSGRTGSRRGRARRDRAGSRRGGRPDPRAPRSRGRGRRAPRRTRRRRAGRPRGRTGAPPAFARAEPPPPRRRAPVSRRRPRRTCSRTAPGMPRGSGARPA